MNLKADLSEKIFNITNEYEGSYEDILDVLLKHALDIVKIMKNKKEI